MKKYKNTLDKVTLLYYNKGMKNKKEVAEMILTSTSAEKARALLAVIDKIVDNPPQNLSADDVEILFEQAQKIRLQVARMEK